MLDLPLASSNISGREGFGSATIFPLETTLVVENRAFLRSIFGASNRIGPGGPRQGDISEFNVHSVIEELSERYVWLIGVYKMSKVVRIFVLCHLAFLAIFFLFSPIYMLFIPFLIIGKKNNYISLFVFVSLLHSVGYIGARTFNYKSLVVYSTYIILDIIAGFVLLFLTKSLFFVFLRSLMIILDFYIMRYLAKLTITVYRFCDEDMDFVRSSPIIYNLDRSSCL